MNYFKNFRRKRIDFSKNKIREYKENRVEKIKMGKELVEWQRVL